MLATVQTRPDMPDPVERLRPPAEDPQSHAERDREELGRFAVKEWSW